MGCHIKKTIILQKKTFESEKDAPSEKFLLHSKELHELYMLPSFVRTVKCRKVSRNADRMRDTKNICRSLLENLFENVHLGDCKEAGKIILRLVSI
jgi:hypothetical protein